MEESIVEGNKLIAEFMGGEIRKGYATSTYEYCDFKNNIGTISETCRVDNLKYHSSWDWLMPVVEKIEGISKGHSVYILTSQFEIYDAPFTECAIWVRKEPFAGISGLHIWHTTNEDRSKIKAVWLAVVEFIKWYNQNK